MIRRSHPERDRGFVNIVTHPWFVMQVTTAYHAWLPAQVRDHLTCRIVERLETVVQHHVIDGLLLPDY